MVSAVVKYTRAVPRISNIVSNPRIREVLVVASLLIALQTLVFGGFLSGAIIPQFDFMGGYNTEAFAWWRDGGFVAPTQWMPYMWGGYPAVSNLQNSSFYLPFGLVAAVVPFTLQASAAVSALHVAFGATGLYVFTRRWGAGIVPSLVGLVGWFFAAGIYSNATQPDIARAYAWLPWVLLIASVKWPWWRWYGPVLAVLLLWQAVLGIYPGTIVALAYLLPIWVIANQVLFRPKITSYLVPLLIAGLAAGAMTAVRFLPAILTRGTYEAVFPDVSVFGIATIGTFLYPFTNPKVPDFEVMRSFFLPAVFLPLLVFVPWRSKLVRAVAIVTGAAVVLGMPFWPWHDAVTNFLPGMQLSRFRMSDFKVIMLFGIVVLAVFALHRLVVARREVTTETVAGTVAATAPAHSQSWTRWVPLTVLVLLNLGFAAIGLRYNWDPVASIPQWVILAAVSVIAYLLSRPPGLDNPRGVVAGIGLLAVISGLVGVFAVTPVWRTERVAAENNYFGGQVSDFIAARPADLTAEQRPARLPSPDDPTNRDEIYWVFGKVFYTGDASVFGYVNLRGNETWETIKNQLFAGGDLGRNNAAFWAAPGMLITGAPSTMPAPAESTVCAESGQCGPDLTVTPVSYDPGGKFSYDVVADRRVDVMANEAWYTGWQAELCSSDGACAAVETARGVAGQLTMTVPEGSWRLNLEYRLPGWTVAWAAFAGGVIAAALLGVWAGLSSRGGNRPRPLDRGAHRA